MSIVKFVCLAGSRNPYFAEFKQNINTIVYAQKVMGVLRFQVFKGLYIYIFLLLSKALFQTY